jgi:hypothetical protein
VFDFQLPPSLIDGDHAYWYAVISQDEPLSLPLESVGHPAAEDGAKPRVLILEPGGVDDAFLSRYDRGLGYITDVWHPTREAAIEDASEEFGDRLGPWSPIPDGEDSELFVRRTLRRNE